MDNSVSDLGNQATVSMSTSMMISMHDHQMSLESMRKELSAQKEALESSFKKKEEDSTKRRQVCGGRGGSLLYANGRRSLAILFLPPFK